MVESIRAERELEQVVATLDGAEEVASAELEPHPTPGKLLPPRCSSKVEFGRSLTCARLAGHRNQALLAILWRTGARISEALELRPHNVDFQNGTVRVRFGKGLEPRTMVQSDLDALPSVERGIEERGNLA